MALAFSTRYCATSCEKLKFERRLIHAETYVRFDPTAAARSWIVRFGLVKSLSSRRAVVILLNSSSVSAVVALRAFSSSSFPTCAMVSSGREVCDVSQPIQEYRHENRGYSDECRAVEGIPAEEVEEHRGKSSNADEKQEGVGRLQEVTAVVGVVVIQPSPGCLDQPVSAYQDPNDLCGKAKTGYKPYAVFEVPMEAEVEREEECHQCRRKKQKRYFEGCLRARECAQVRII